MTRDRLRLFAALVVLGAVAALEGHRLVHAPFEYVLWSDRDLLRAAHFARDWPSSGAELSYVEGGRVPGGFLYALWALPLAVSPDPALVWRFGVLLEIVAALGVGRLVARRAGPWAGALAASFQVAAAASVETMLRLWNPGFVPAFAAGAVGCAVVAAEGGGPVAWLGLGLLAALGAQLHLGVLLFGLGLLVGLVATGVPGRLRGVPAALLGVLLGYAPYLVAEARQGWPNTRSLLADAGTSVPERAGVGEVAAGLLRFLRTGGVASADGFGWTTLVGLGALIAVGLAARDAARRDARARPVLVLLAGLLAVPAFHWVEGKSQLGRDWEGRYVVPTVSAAAVLIGLGWGRAEGWLRRRSWAASAALLAVVTAAAAAAPLGARAVLPRPSIDHWGFLKGVLDAVQADTGWTLREVAGRTVIARPLGPERWGHVAEQGGDFLLDRQGATFPGSLPSPCALVLQHGAFPFPDGVDAASVQAVLGQDLGPIEVRSQRRLGPHQLVVYAVDGACPTTLSNRYDELPEEAVIRGRWRALAPDTAVPVEGPDDVARFVLRAVPEGSGAGLGLAVDVPRVEGAPVVLHGNQLRGNAYNPGLLSNVLLRAPRLALISGEARVEVPLARDLVGHRGLLTPLRSTAPMPAGDWEVSFVATSLPVPGEGEPVDEAGAAPIRVPLGRVQVVPSAGRAAAPAE